MLDVVGENLDGLVLKGVPKENTLEANLDAYTKPNLVKLAETNAFEVKQSWNKDQMIEVISEGLRDSLDERLSAFEGEQLAVLQEISKGNTKRVEENNEVLASAVSNGLLYVSPDKDEMVYSIPNEFEEKLNEISVNDEPAVEKEDPAAKAVHPSAPKVPFGFRRQRTKPVVKQRIVGKKIGRNEPCPCGSGKKYKKCCWRNDQRS